MKPVLDEPTLKSVEAAKSISLLAEESRVSLGKAKLSLTRTKERFDKMGPIMSNLAVDKSRDASIVFRWILDGHLGYCPDLDAIIASIDAFVTNIDTLVTRIKEKWGEEVELKKIEELRQKEKERQFYEETYKGKEPF